MTKREPTRTPQRVVQLGVDAAEVVDVLCEAFFDYPVMRFVLGPARVDYATDLRTLVGLFVKSRVLRGEYLLGIRGDVGLEAAAVVSRVGGSASPAALTDLRERVWSDLGAEARARYDSYVAASEPFVPKTPHIHLNMIGVRNRARGGGLARILLDRVHSLARADPASDGVSLSTENPANVALYEHVGYEVVGHAVVAPELETWAFYLRR